MRDEREGMREMREREMCREMWRVVGGPGDGRVVHTGWSVPHSLVHIGGKCPQGGVFHTVWFTWKRWRRCPHRVECFTQFGSHREGVSTGWGVPCSLVHMEEMDEVSTQGGVFHTVWFT